MIKPTKRILELCNEMFERKAACGKDYPWNWKQKTREKLEVAGIVDCKGDNPGWGKVYYFTKAGLEWYLPLRS